MKKLTKAGQEIVETSMFLFFQYGIKKISIEEICKFANVSKQTFKKHFKNKEDLVVRILQVLNKDSKTRIMKVINANIPIKEKLYQLILLKEEISQESSTKFNNDILTEKDSAICKLVKKNENDWKKRLRKFFKDCQEKNEIRNDINIDFMVFMIENLRRMFRDEQVQDIYPDFSDMTRELMSFFYYGFLKQ